MRTISVLSLVVWLFVGGCTSLNDGVAGTNQVTVLLTDAPAADATHLRVTFARVDLVSAEETGCGVITVYDGEPVTYDILTLTNGASEDLARDVPVPDGTYDQVRFIIDGATLSFCDDVALAICHDADVFVPSGARTGLKVNVQPPLILGGGANQTLVFDFDVERAIVETPPGSGNYLLKPTALRVVSDPGAIAGSVLVGDPGGRGGVRIEVYPTGTTDTDGLVVATDTEDDGTFAFTALLPGSYDLCFVRDGYESVFVGDVLVEIGKTTQVGAIDLR